MDTEMVNAVMDKESELAVEAMKAECEVEPADETETTTNRHYVETVLKDSPKKYRDVIRRVQPSGQVKYLVSDHPDYPPRVLRDKDVCDGNLGALLEEHIIDLKCVVDLIPEDSDVGQSLLRCFHLMLNQHYEWFERLFDLVDQDIGEITIDYVSYTSGGSLRPGQPLRAWIDGQNSPPPQASSALPADERKAFEDRISALTKSNETLLRVNLRYREDIANLVEKVRGNERRDNDQAE